MAIALSYQLLFTIGLDTNEIGWSSKLAQILIRLYREGLWCSSIHCQHCHRDIHCQHCHRDIYFTVTMWPNIKQKEDTPFKSKAFKIQWEVMFNVI